MESTECQCEQCRVIQYGQREIRGESVDQGRGEFDKRLYQVCEYFAHAKGSGRSYPAANKRSAFCLALMRA